MKELTNLLELLMNQVAKKQRTLASEDQAVHVAEIKFLF